MVSHGFSMDFEAILRLSVEISEAINCDDAARAQRAQRELCQAVLTLDSPRSISSSCFGRLLKAKSCEKL